MTSHENDNIELVCRLKAKMFEMSNSEFVSAICRRNAVEDATIPKYTAWISRENPQLFYCACDGRYRPKAIDPFDYHLVGCKIGVTEDPGNQRPDVFICRQALSMLL